MDYIELVNQTDLRYWFPAVQKSGVLYPKTVLIEDGIDFWDLVKVLDGKKPKTLEGLVERVAEASKEVGTPFFLRTSHLSGKHSWVVTCYCHSHDIKLVGRNVCGLIDATVMTGQPLGCFAVREFLKLQSLFTAFDGMPVAREFRIFVKDREALHIQPYWPPTSIRRPSVRDWRYLLGWLNALESGVREILESLAKRVSSHIGGFWSVDFAQTVDGDWYLIDMARGELSYCWFPERGKADEGTTGVELLKGSA